MNDDRMVQLASYQVEEEALDLLDLLSDHGIPATIRNSYSARMLSAFVDVGGFIIEVPESARPQIQELIDSGAVLKKLEEFILAQEEKGAACFIAGAGMAAALPAVVASMTLRPVIGVPLSGARLDGMDALFSIVQMPSGIPVATVAIDGAKNAAYLAVEIGAAADRDLYRKYKEYREEMAAEIYRKDEKLQNELK